MSGVKGMKHKVTRVKNGAGLYNKMLPPCLKNVNSNLPIPEYPFDRNEIKDILYMRKKKKEDYVWSEKDVNEHVCNFKGAEELTDKQLIEIDTEVLSMLRTGYRNPQIIDWIITNYPFISKQRAKLILDRNRIAVREEYENFMKNLVMENINTLIQIRNDALKSGNKTTAITAIDVINKMTGQYLQKQEVKVNSDEPVVVKFGG